MELRKLRRTLERISGELVALLDQRFELVREVARIKRAHGLPYRDPQRDEVIIERMVHASSGKAPPEAIRAVMTAILNSSVDMMAAEDEPTDSIRPPMGPPL